MMREEKMKSTGEKMTGMRVIRKLLREKAQEALVRSEERRVGKECLE